MKECSALPMPYSNTAIMQAEKEESATHTLIVVRFRSSHTICRRDSYRGSGCHQSGVHHLVYHDCTSTMFGPY